jgi:DNA polymerase I-like protein with 3'-5' exonuclease and polymerase domains
MAQVTKEQRQLGKKAGHASNYGMKAFTFVATCLKEMDLVIPVTKAERMLEGYHKTFPGIRRWQTRICEEVMRNRKLTTPLGRERYFYQRPGDDLNKEAYAYRPQSTVTDCINHLVLHMFRHAGLVVQIHDSLLMEIKEAELAAVLERIKDQDAWNPRMMLPGGELRIPIEIKYGRNWANMEVCYEG